MKKLLPITIALACASAAQAQVTSCASFLRAGRQADVVVPFRYDDPGVQTPLEWGLDLAWLSEDNVRTGILYVGKDMIDVVRMSYQPTYDVEDGSLASDQTDYINQRANIVKTWCKSGVGYYINDDNPSVDDWYNYYYDSDTRTRRWATVIDLTADHYKNRGLTNLVSIAPFNEPDYYTGQSLNIYTAESDLKDICKLFKEDEAYAEKYADVRLCGGNTLNTDYAYEWWNNAKDYLDEGNTHQLAGSFDNYASFYETLTQYGHHATNDELHNVMECMVGAEYGLQTGIWWGCNENVRSQFMKATYHENPGERLAYAEHRDNWTSASVYRQPTGEVQAFGGMSERQSYTTCYDFLSLDRPVWYDGQRGRDYPMYLIGGTGYQTGQTSAEVVVNIQGGTDAQPHIDGTYKVMNVHSGRLLGFGSNPSKTDWVSASQRSNSTYSYVQWIVTPLAGEDTWGDQSYYSFTLNTGNGLVLDILNWNYSSGADVGSYAGDLGTNEQWYLEYAGQGAFYIRSRYSAKCLEVVDSKTAIGANVQMGDFTGEDNQQWRFLDTKATPDLEAPDAPSNLRATLQSASVRLDWDASPSKDLKEYCVVRNGSLLARGITGCDFTDNEAEQDSSYTYSVYAVDQSLNQSEASNEASACAITDEPGLVMRLALSEDLLDETENGNHCAVYGDTTFVTNSDHKAISLSDNFLQLPYTVASHDALTVSCWLRCGAISSWQRVFDFGNGTDQYLFLTVKGDSGPRFAIKDGGEEETVDASSTLIAGRWYHLAVTVGEGKACLYIDGELKGENDNLSTKPSDIRPLLNYIGRSQFPSDPLLKGYVDDFRVYNYALSAEEVAELTTGIDTPEAAERQADAREYDLSGRRVTKGERGVIITGDGRKVLR
ncbi:MAG: RICIN domain-containing protein [Prevotellaceae bacterium]|nr:RICIN domain-containing protein [Prevotellaceae bacterium]